MKFKILQLVIVFSVLIFASCNRTSSVNKNVKLINEIDTVSYSLGVDIGNSVKQGGIEEININAFAAGFMQIIDGDSTSISPEKARKNIQEFFKKLQNIKMENNLKEGKAFLEENKKKEGVITTKSGLQYKIITKGEGAIPTAEDKVRVHYQGTLLNGEVFDSSYERGEPSEFLLSRIIKGWQEALMLMPVGSKWKVFIPSDIAYGKRGTRGAIGPNMTLIFEMELLEIVKQKDKKGINEVKGQ